MRAPIGAVTSITYDTDDGIVVGDWLRTSTGRAYQVLAVRTVRRGPNAGTRHRLSVLVAAAVPPNMRVHALVWYRRDPAR